MTSKKYNLSSKGKLAILLETLIPRWFNRPDSEHEQAVIRLVVGLVAALYLIIAYCSHNNGLSGTTFMFAGITLFFIASTIIIIWLIINPGISVTRRLFGAFIDTGASSLALYLHGNLAAPFFVVYLWVIFGNGFRFGRTYLYFSMALSIAGYCLVLLLKHWTGTPYLSIGMLAGLIVLPLYVVSLLERLTTALKESEAANEAKAIFLAVMSHEIRTPLSGITGLISLLQQTRLNEQQLHYIKLMENSSIWLTRVISDGLDYSKIEADELVIDNKPFNLSQLIEDISAVYQEMALSRGLGFSCEISDDVPEYLVGDQFKLVQVCNNLLSNAFKFTQKGKIVLAVTLKSLKNDMAETAFEVSDTGIGIAEKEIDSIFQPFKQVDSSSSRQYGGTGLGLAISSKIVSLLGGSLKVKSVVDMGTQFNFSLPFSVAINTEELSVTSGDAVNSSVHWTRSPDILLVEDNDVNREVISQLLHAIGAEVTVAVNGDHAVELVRNTSFDMIFMDCQMPIVDGYEATRRIRKEHGDRDILPVIALTAHVTVADKERCFAAGMNGYLGKPCSLSDLQSALMEWLPDLFIESENADSIEETAKGRIKSAVESGGENMTLSNRAKIHDLRNTYSKIMGSAELALISRNSPEKLEGYLRVILAETRKAADTSEQIE